MSRFDDIGKRMKNYYETISDYKLTRRMPVILRIDGRSFHTFTLGFDKPFDNCLRIAMEETLKYLCSNIQGCVFGYTQSDEITLILVDYNNLQSESWFGYRVQKLSSIAASMATLSFNKNLDKAIESQSIFFRDGRTENEYEKYISSLSRARKLGAMFDCRAFNLPKEEVANLIYWRQLDAVRNSIQGWGRKFFTHTELKNKNTREIKDMLLEKGFNWESLTPPYQSGVCCLKNKIGKWVIDTQMPIVKGSKRSFINDLIYYNEEVAYD